MSADNNEAPVRRFFALAEPLCQFAPLPGSQFTILKLSRGRESVLRKNYRRGLNRAKFQPNLKGGVQRIFSRS
jgi:hypothetical protein